MRIHRKVPALRPSPKTYPEAVAAIIAEKDLAVSWYYVFHGKGPATPLDIKMRELWEKNVLLSLPVSPRRPFLLQELNNHSPTRTPPLHPSPTLPQSWNWKIRQRHPSACQPRCLHRDRRYGGEVQRIGTPTPTGFCSLFPTVKPFLSLKPVIEKLLVRFRSGRKAL